MSTDRQLLPDPLPIEPMTTAAAWLAEAWQRRMQPNPDAMVLATVDSRGQPAARVVLCKQIVADPGYLLFYTNYGSRKGREIATNPRGAAVMHWDQLHRQLRIEGPIVKALSAESDAYFATRAWQSRVGAWASEQSEPVAARPLLLEAVRKAAARLGTPDVLSPSPPGTDVAVPRPPHWGGYRLWAQTVELWVEGEYRIHDRARWTRSLTPAGEHEFRASAWMATRLQP
jgi:pyridoxamine 5'-phosphate oxidase